MSADEHLHENALGERTRSWGLFARSGRGYACLMGVLLAFVLCACGSGQPAANGDQVAQVPTTQSGATNVVDPLEEALEDLFGYSLSDVSWAAERAAAELLAACMSESGWEYEIVVPERFDPMGFERVPAGESALEDIDQRIERESELIEDAPAVVNEDPQFAVDEADCWRTAVESIPDPVSSAWSWLHSETSGLYDRVAADPRVVEAKATEVRCLEQTGYEATTVTELDNGFERRAYEVYESVRAGEMARDQAAETLEALSSEQRAMWTATDRCNDMTVAAIRDVAHELESEWLTANHGRLAAAVQDLASDVEQITDQLLQIQSGA